MESSHLEGTLTVCPFEKFSARRLLSFKVKDFAFEGNEENQTPIQTHPPPNLPRNNSSGYGLSPPFLQDLEPDQRSVLSRRKGPMIAVNPSQPSLHDVHREGMSETTAPTDDSGEYFEEQTRKFRALTLNV